MGNCTGIFQSCKGSEETGANEHAVKKIDKDQIQKALAVNSQDFHDGFGRPKQNQ